MQYEYLHMHEFCASTGDVTAWQYTPPVSHTVMSLAPGTHTHRTKLTDRLSGCCIITRERTWSSDHFLSTHAWWSWEIGVAYLDAMTSIHLKWHTSGVTTPPENIRCRCFDTYYTNKNITELFQMGTLNTNTVSGRAEIQDYSFSTSNWPVNSDHFVLAIGIIYSFQWLLSSLRL